MGKRGNGEGSVYQRKDGRWVGQYVVQMADGPKYRYIYGKTRKAVAERLTKAMADRDGGLVFEAGDVTVGEYLERWLTDCVRDTVKDSTYSSYTRLAEKHAIPPLMRTKLKAFNAAHVRALFRGKLDEGLSARTVQYLRFILRKAMDQAVSDGLISRNPVLSVKSPQVRREEIMPLNQSEARRFLEAASESGDRLEALYILAVHTGLRQGELFALKWEDINLDTRTLQVRRTLARVENGEPVFTTPKTAKSRRQVRLTNAAITALRAHRKRQLEQHLEYEGIWPDSGLVFTSETGTPLNRHNVAQRSFKPLLKRAGLRDIRFHDLRHTCATLLLSTGQHPKFVQELLGHSTIAITLDTYSHVLPGMGDGLADAMENALG